MKSMQKLMCGTGVLALAAMLAACGGDEDDASGAGENAENEATTEKVIEMADQPGSVEEYEGAADDVEVESCEESDGSLQVAGTVTNPESDAKQYRIYVSAMDGSDTMGLVQVDLEEVAAGETAEWSTDMGLQGEQLECVLRVERFATQ